MRKSLRSVKRSVKRRSLRSRIKRSKGIPALNQGTLRKFGYGIHKLMKSRRRSLKKAVRKYGRNTVIHKLTAVRTLSRNRSPKNAKIYTKDIKFVQSL